MKKSLFVILLISQIFIFLLIPLQYELISSYGKSITLLSEDVSNKDGYDQPLPSEEVHETNGFNYPLYINFDINYISDEVWQPVDDIEWGTRVYVVISPNDEGIYEVTAVNKEKVQVAGEDILLPGQYQYSDEMANHHYVQYGFETVRNGFRQFDFDLNKQWLISVDVAPWGQYVVQDVRNHP